MKRATALARLAAATAMPLLREPVGAAEGTAPTTAPAALLEVLAAGNARYARTAPKSSSIAV